MEMPQYATRKPVVFKQFCSLVKLFAFTQYHFQSAEFSCASTAS